MANDIDPDKDGELQARRTGDVLAYALHVNDMEVDRAASALLTGFLALMRLISTSTDESIMDVMSESLRKLGAREACMLMQLARETHDRMRREVALAMRGGRS